MAYAHTYRTEHSETHTTNSVYGEYYAQLQSRRIKIQPDLLKILQYTDSHRDSFLKDLSDITSIKSVSGDLKFKPEMDKMTRFTQRWLKKLGLKFEPFSIGTYEVDGETINLPCIILASLGTDPAKKTLVIYANIDVRKPSTDSPDPWTVRVENNRVFGCGVAQGKANLLQWFHVLEAFQASSLALPVNLRFVIEGMYHGASRGLEDFLALRKHDYFINIDHIVYCDSEWLSEKHPCLIYGAVGMIHYDLIAERVENSRRDPRDDLEEIAKRFVDGEERVLIPHFLDIVRQVTPEEERMYEAIKDFDIEAVRANLPAYKKHWDQVKLLMSFWRFPAVSVGATEECLCPDKAKDVVKKHMVCKIVPSQIIERNVKLTLAHFNNVVNEHNTKNSVKCELVSSSRYWLENPANACFQAARRACIQVYKEDPNMIREDRPLVIPGIFDRVLEKSVLLLPLASKGSNAGGDNESLSLRNFYESTKLLAAYLFQVSKPIFQ